MTAIQLKCLECGELFWSDGFTKTCMKCALKEDAKNPRIWEIFPPKKCEIIEPFEEWELGKNLYNY